MRIGKQALLFHVILALIVSVLPRTAHAQKQLYSSYISEQALAEQSDSVLMFEDFERDDWYRRLLLSSSGIPTNVSLVSNPAFKGSKSMRVVVPQGTHEGCSIALRLYMFWMDKYGEAKEPEEIYFRFYMYLASNYKCSGTVGKLPGLAGTYGCCAGGVHPDGTNGWSARGLNTDHGDAVEIGQYVYHPDMGGTWGEHWGWGADAYLQRQRWYCVEHYVKMNSISGSRGNYDGILRGWVDGKQVYEKTGMRFRDVSEVKIKDAWMNVYVGGTWTAPQNMEVFFDNIAIATELIGTYSSPASARPTPVVGSSRPTTSLAIYDVHGKLLKATSPRAHEQYRAPAIYYTVPLGPGLPQSTALPSFEE